MGGITGSFLEEEPQCAVGQEAGPGSKGPHQQGEQTSCLPWDSLHLLCLVLILIMPFLVSRVSPWVTISSPMLRHVKSSGLDYQSTREPVKSSGLSLRKNVVEGGLGPVCVCVCTCAGKLASKLLQ